MLCYFLGLILSLLTAGAVNTVNDPLQDIENVYRVITIPMDTTIQDEGYTNEGEYIENVNMYGKE